MHSMTGYGRGRACRDGRELTLELKSVNHRFLDVSFRLPRNFSFLEDALRTLLNQSDIKRGHVDVFATYQNLRDDARSVSLDKSLLAALNEAIEGAGKQLADYKRATVAEIITLSGALNIAQSDEDTDAIASLATEAFGEALGGLLAMREREGAHLADDLLKNLGELKALRARIEERAPEVPSDYRKRLEARLAEWRLDATDPQRVAQEVAIMADKCAIDEELNRLQSHIAQFEQIVENESETGRKLDFLIQEMNREINTIGSKASDTQIAKCVVDAKCIVEKLREQVQNAV